MKPKLLVVDDEKSIREFMSKSLAAHGYCVFRAANGEEALKVFGCERPEVVFLDMRLPDLSGMQVFEELKKADEVPYVIIITAYGDIKSAVGALKAGAHDYLTKPFKLVEILNILEKIESDLNLKREIVILKQQAKQFRYKDLASKNPEFREILKLVGKVANSDSTVLIIGESGTGKELVARAIHATSPRKERPCVAINCTVLREQLLESELFGHEKGAFTDAHSMRKGLIEYADGGTVFLDEIGDMSPELQAKLLRFLEERSFRRLGSNQLIEVDVRIIAATHQNLKTLISSGAFREDLYFRLMVVPISLPPLRKRKEDILDLARVFLKDGCLELGKRPKEIGADAATALLRYAWPGNIRELRNMMERVALIGKAEVVGLGDLTFESSEEAQATVEERAGILEADSYRKAKETVMSRFQKDYFDALLRVTGGNVAECARRAGINRSHLQEILASLKINLKDYRQH